jgi:hypothetical protein
LTKNMLGYILGVFFLIASGHPACKPRPSGRATQPLKMQISKAKLFQNGAKP